MVAGVIEQLPLASDNGSHLRGAPVVKGGGAVSSTPPSNKLEGALHGHVCGDLAHHCML
jgi:hypothetical protein